VLSIRTLSAPSRRHSAHRLVDSRDHLRRSPARRITIKLRQAATALSAKPTPCEDGYGYNWRLGRYVINRPAAANLQ